MTPSPYRTPGRRAEWTPRVGETVTIVWSDWSLSAGHAGKRVCVVRPVGGKWYEVQREDDSQTLFVHLRDIHPL